MVSCKRPPTKRARPHVPRRRPQRICQRQQQRPLTPGVRFQTSRRIGAIRGIRRHRDDQGREELLGVATENEQAGNGRHGGIVARHHAERPQKHDAVLRRQFGQRRVLGGHQPRKAAQRPLIQIREGCAVHRPDVLRRLGARDQGQIDLVFGHLAVAVTDAHIGATVGSARADEGGSELRGHFGSFGGDHDLAVHDMCGEGQAGRGLQIGRRGGQIAAGGLGLPRRPLRNAPAPTRRAAPRHPDDSRRSTRSVRGCALPRALRLHIVEFRAAQPQLGEQFLQLSERHATTRAPPVRRTGRTGIQHIQFNCVYVAGCLVQPDRIAAAQAPDFSGGGLSRPLMQAPAPRVAWGG